jgi:hypothetical protein
MADELMDLNTAVDLAENYRTKVARPFERLAEVLRLARDSQQLVTAYSAQVPVLEAELAHLEAERQTAWASVAAAKEYALRETVLCEQAAQAVTATLNQHKVDSRREADGVAAGLLAERQRLEAEQQLLRQRLTEETAAAQARLDGLKAEYEQLMANIRSKFSA